VFLAVVGLTAAVLSCFDLSAARKASTPDDTERLRQFGRHPGPYHASEHAVAAPAGPRITEDLELLDRVSSRLQELSWRVKFLCHREYRWLDEQGSWSRLEEARSLPSTELESWREDRLFVDQMGGYGASVAHAQSSIPGRLIHFLIAALLLAIAGVIAAATRFGRIGAVFAAAATGVVLHGEAPDSIILSSGAATLLLAFLSPRVRPRKDDTDRTTSAPRAHRRNATRLIAGGVAAIVVSVLISIAAFAAARELGMASFAVSGGGIAWGLLRLIAGVRAMLAR